MRRLKRLLQLAAGLIGLVLYVWFAAVRLLPAVKRRKGQSRSRRS